MRLTIGTSDPWASIKAVRIWVTYSAEATGAARIIVVDQSVNGGAIMYLEGGSTA